MVNSETILVILVIIIVFIIGMVALQRMNTINQNYYYNQARALCSMSNSYRQMLLIANPELKSVIPKEVDCKRILEIVICQ